MKFAKLVVSAVELLCPECGEKISSHKGCRVFSLNEPIPELLVCDGCGEKLKSPAKAKKLQEELN
jgi:predicted RNA-binding Zn-ribbon protein involved in translation (DUF1610 family)